MDQDLKNKLDAILNKTPKKTPAEVKELLLNNQAFITFEKVLALIHDKKQAQQLYLELKQTLPEFYLITYKDHAIRCGWSKDLSETETSFYCKALDESFMLSKNKIHYSLINNQSKFQDKINEQMKGIEAACNQNN